MMNQMSTYSPHLNPQVSRGELGVELELVVLEGCAGVLVGYRVGKVEEERLGVWGTVGWRRAWGSLRAGPQWAGTLVVAAAATSWVEPAVRGGVLVGPG